MAQLHGAGRTSATTRTDQGGGLARAGPGLHEQRGLEVGGIRSRAAWSGGADSTADMTSRGWHRGCDSPARRYPPVDGGPDPAAPAPHGGAPRGGRARRGPVRSRRPARARGDRPGPGPQVHERHVVSFGRSWWRPPPARPPGRPGPSWRSPAARSRPPTPTACDAFADGRRAGWSGTSTGRTTGRCSIGPRAPRATSSSSAEVLGAHRRPAAPRRRRAGGGRLRRATGGTASARATSRPSPAGSTPSRVRPAGDATVVRTLLEFAVHDLGSRGIGAPSSIDPSPTRPLPRGPAASPPRWRSAGLGLAPPSPRARPDRWRGGVRADGVRRQLGVRLVPSGGGRGRDRRARRHPSHLGLGATAR